MIVRDDEDILPYTISHYYHLGIKKMYICNHMPTDSVQDILSNLEDKYKDLMIERFYENEPIMIQEVFMRTLTNQAMLDGYEWIIASDSDEILVLNKTLDQLFENYPIGTCLLFRWRHNKIIKEAKAISPYDRMESIKFMDEDNAGWVKSVGRFRHGMDYSAGQHTIIDADSYVYIPKEIGFYEHLPFRSEKDIFTKNARKLVYYTARGFDTSSIFTE